MLRAQYERRGPVPQDVIWRFGVRGAAGAGRFQAVELPRRAGGREPARGGKTALRRAGLEAQRAAIAAECDRRGWDLTEVIEGRRLLGEGPATPRHPRGPR